MTFRELLPKPCRFEDLTRVCELGHIQTIGIICDGFSDEAEVAIRQWSEIAPNCSFVLFVQPMFDGVIDATKQDMKKVKQFHRIVSYRDILKISDSLEINVWGTLSTYDAFSVLVKTELESVLAKILKRNSGVFLAHNTEHKIIRCFDHTALNDRIRYRPYRVLVYRVVCWCIKAFARCGLHFRSTNHSWKKIR